LANICPPSVPCRPGKEDILFVRHFAIGGELGRGEDRKSLFNVSKSVMHAP